MDAASKYWRFIKITAAGRRSIENIAAAQRFFSQQFPRQSGIPDTQIQRQLLSFYQEALKEIDRASNSAIDRSAEFCLRCFISHQIEQVCLQLAAQFGQQHGFSQNDLLPLVLVDEVLNGRPSAQVTAYRSLATEILQSFDPDRANLSTWASRLTRQHRELNAFLLEQGVYLVSDWAILNDTRPQQLPRIFSQFQPLSLSEIEGFCQLLTSYHSVYRRDRLRQRQTGSQHRCAAPTPEQLEQMAAYLQAQANLTLSTSAVLHLLQTLATHLREYRMAVRSGTRSMTSLDQPEAAALAAQIQAEPIEEAEEEQQFLSYYRQQLLEGLDRTLAQVVSDRLSALRRKQGQAQQFLTALFLFHCQGRSMGEIATQIGLQAQYQVTRLLKLKELRADVRQRLLVDLRDRLGERAKAYADPDRLLTLDQQLEAALGDQIATIIQQAEVEAATNRNQPLESLFAKRLCFHLDTREPLQHELLT